MTVCLCPRAIYSLISREARKNFFGVTIIGIRGVPARTFLWEKLITFIKILVTGLKTAWGGQKNVFLHVVLRDFWANKIFSSIFNFSWVNSTLSRSKKWKFPYHCWDLVIHDIFFPDPYRPEMARIFTTHRFICC